MKSSGNSRDDLSAWIPVARAFGVERYGTLKAFAEALGMTPQNLNGYLSGGRRPGKAFISRLDRLGCDISLILHEDKAGDVSDQNKRAARPHCESIDFDAAEFVLGRSLERAAPQFGATPEEVSSWRDGTEPPLDKLVRLTNLILYVDGCRRRPLPFPVRPRGQGNSAPPRQRSLTVVARQGNRIYIAPAPRPNRLD